MIATCVFSMSSKGATIAAGAKLDLPLRPEILALGSLVEWAFTFEPPDVLSFAVEANDQAGLAVTNRVVEEAPAGQQRAVGGCRIPQNCKSISLVWDNTTAWRRRTLFYEVKILRCDTSRLPKVSQSKSSRAAMLDIFMHSLQQRDKGYVQQALQQQHHEQRTSMCTVTTVKCMDGDSFDVPTMKTVKELKVLIEQRTGASVAHQYLYVRGKTDALADNSTVPVWYCTSSADSQGPEHGSTVGHRSMCIHLMCSCFPIYNYQSPSDILQITPDSISEHDIQRFCLARDPLALTSLTLAGCKKIADVTVLLTLQNLTALDVQGCQVSNVGVLSSLKILQHVNLAQNHLGISQQARSNVSILLKSSLSLLSLDISDNQLKNHNPIAFALKVSPLSLSPCLSSLFSLPTLIICGAILQDNRALVSLTFNGGLEEWNRNRGMTEWKEGSAVTITTSMQGPTTIFGIDVDADGDIDVLSATGYDDAVGIVWFENTRSPPVVTIRGEYLESTWIVMRTSMY